MLPKAKPIAVGLLALSATLLADWNASGKPLDKETCASLKIERSKLLTKEMKKALEQGPDWVKDHLDKEKIEHIRHFLKVEEQFVFRCRGGGVAKPKVAAMPLPDRKPSVPLTASSEAKATETVALPVRKPEPPSMAATNVKASQTLADSDKTAPTDTRATQ